MQLPHSICKMAELVFRICRLISRPTTITGHRQCPMFGYSNFQILFLTLNGASRTRNGIGSFIRPFLTRQQLSQFVFTSINRKIIISRQNFLFTPLPCIYKTMFSHLQLNSHLSNGKLRLFYCTLFTHQNTAIQIWFAIIWRAMSLQNCIAYRYITIERVYFRSKVPYVSTN